MTGSVASDTPTDDRIMVEVVEDMRVFTFDAATGNPIIFGVKVSDGKKGGSKSISIYKRNPSGEFERVGKSVYLEYGFVPTYPNAVIEKFTRLSGVPDGDFPIVITTLEQASKTTLEDIDKEVIKQLSDDASLHPTIDYDPHEGIIYGTLLERGVSGEPMLRSLHFGLNLAFCCQNGDTPIEGAFANRVRYPKGGIPPVHNEIAHTQMLLLWGEARDRQKKGKEVDNGEIAAVAPPTHPPIIKRIEEKAREYIYLNFQNQETGKYVEGLYLLFSLWNLGTHLFPVFTHYPYLFLFGLRETAKSTMLWFSYYVAWNPTEPEILPTAPLLFRTIESTRPTLLIDEAHKIFSGSRTEEGDGASVSAVLESGFQKVGVARRLIAPLDKSTDYSVGVFHTYCPKVLASRRPLDIQEKSITIPTVEAPEGMGYEQRTALMDRDEELKNIRPDCMRWSLQHSKQVAEIYEQLKPEPPFVGRQHNLWAPLIAICRVACPEREDELREIASHLIGSHESSEFADTVLLALGSMPRAENPTPDDIIKAMGDEYATTRPSTIGNAIKALRVSRGKTKGRPTKYQIAWERVDNKIEARKLKNVTDEEQATLPPDDEEIANALEDWRRKHYFDKYPATPERWAGGVADSPEFSNINNSNYNALLRIAQRKFDEQKLKSETSPTAVERAEKAIKLKLDSWNTTTQGEPTEHGIAKLVQKEHAELDLRQLATLARDISRGDGT